jgi:SOS-response transcriptional repressor LexA
MLLGRNPPTMEEVLEKLVTPVQSEVFLVIDEWWKKYGYAPSYRDIAYVRGKAGIANTKRIIDKLVELGAVKRIEGKFRSVRPVYLNFKNIN